MEDFKTEQLLVTWGGKKSHFNSHLSFRTPLSPLPVTQHQERTLFVTFILRAECQFLISGMALLEAAVFSALDDPHFNLLLCL